MTALLRTRRAPLRPASIDEAARTVEAVIATAYPVERRDAAGPFVEVLTVTPAAVSLHVPHPRVVYDHRAGDSAAVKGFVVRAWIEGGRLLALLKITDDACWARVLDGTDSYVSIGYRVLEAVEGAAANGVRRVTVTAFAVMEVSIIPVPADPSAGIRSLELAVMEDEDVGLVEAEDSAAPDGQAVRIAIEGMARILPLSEEEVAEAVEDAGQGAEPRSAVLATLRRRSAPLRTARVQVLQDHDDPRARARHIGEAIFARVAPQHELSAPARQYAGMSFVDAARSCLRQAGISTTGLSPASAVERALNTTSDFPLAVEAVLGNVLRPEYERPRGGIELLAAAKTVSNFDERKDVQFSAAPHLEKVNEAGEFKYGSLAELGAALYLLATYGRIVGVTRQLLIGDKLGAIAEIGTKLGREAGDFKLRRLVDLLTAGGGLGPTMAEDGATLFHASHGNLASSGAGIGETTLSAARLAMRRQVDAFGERIQVTPGFLLVPPELETEAEKALAAISAARTEDVNAFANGLKLVVESRLTNPSRWYVVANDVPGLEWATLEGEAQPELRTEAGFDVDGTRTRVRLDFGCGFVDHRGWYMNPGQ